jgi:ssDNA-binding Zn-finger/Zn-ribbon topoisomerase 1
MSDVPTCPDCGAKMAERVGRRGSFWGCHAFPICKGVRPMRERPPGEGHLRPKESR